MYIVKRGYLFTLLGCIGRGLLNYDNSDGISDNAAAITDNSDGISDNQSC